MVGIGNRKGCCRRVLVVGFVLRDRIAQLHEAIGTHLSHVIVFSKIIP